MPLSPRPRVARIEARLGSTVEEWTPIESPWPTTTDTAVLALADGRRVVIQSSADGPSIGRRAAVARHLTAHAPALPIPAVIATERDPVPFVVSAFAVGRPGWTAVSASNLAPMAGRLGALARQLTEVPIVGLGGEGPWAEPRRLAAAARGWIDAARGVLGTPLANTLAYLVDELPEVLGHAPAVIAHGDLVPVNTLVDANEAVVALVDFERSRIAHPLFDAAWHRVVVRHHHPAAWPAAGLAFRDGAGIETNPAVDSALRSLGALQLLEALAATTAPRANERAALADRIRAMLAWSD